MDQTSGQGSEDAIEASGQWRQVTDKHSKTEAGAPVSTCPSGRYTALAVQRLPAISGSEFQQRISRVSPRTTISVSSDSCLGIEYRQVRPRKKIPIRPNSAIGSGDATQNQAGSSAHHFEPCCCCFSKRPRHH
jgi:hypothetical protein